MRHTFKQSAPALCFLTVGIVATLPAASQVVQEHDDRAAVEESIQEVLTAFHQRAGFAGGTIGYVLEGGASGSVSVGFADVEENTKMTADHRLCAGSVGKTLFAALALLLIEDGTLALDAKISESLGEEPWFDRLPNAKDITIEHLLNHSAGLPRYVMQPAFQQDLASNPMAERDPDDLLEYIFESAPPFPAGEGFSYADTNFIVLAMVIEKVTGKTCYEQIHERLLDPLDLAGIVPQTSPDIENLANGYVNPNANLVGLDSANVKEGGRMRFNPQFEWAGGGFATTPRDLARWAHALCAGDVLNPETRARMLQGIEADMIEAGEKYGLGVMIRSTEHGPACGHSGYFPGYLTEVFHYPDHGVTLAIQVNSTHLSRELNYTTMRAALDACVERIAKADD